MNHLGLFEGIGGFSLAAHWMGWKTVAWCEWNEFGQRVLKYHFPKAIGHGDITKTDFTPYANKIDILTGGFPCQPYSSAGKRRGKDDDRHLWPQMLRSIREIAPRWIVGENVLGLVNWNGGLVFDEVCADLEAEGYEVAPVVIPAAAVNAPHGRDRIWFVAHSNGSREKHNGRTNNGKEAKIWRENESNVLGKFCSNGPTPHTDHTRNSTHGSGIDSNGAKEIKKRKYTLAKFSGHVQNGWENFPTQPPICGGNDGISGQLDGITFPKWRAESIKAYGNAIVPQVAFEIFKTIELYEKGL